MSVVKLKVLKPQRLKEKEMRLELLNGLRKAAKATEKDYRETVAGWKHEVKFETVIALGKTKAEFLVGTDDAIYRYVDEGTRPHIIRPVKAKALHFFGGGRAKTTPGILRSGAGSRGGSEVFSQGVQHPGTKARKFSELINKKQEKNFRDIMHEAMRNARKKSGHSI